MTNNETPNRRQRRDMYKRAGYLKVKNMFGFGSPQARAWYDKCAKDGEMIHEQNTKNAMDQMENQLQIILDRQKELWTELGYNAEEILLLEESWSLMAVKNKETYREDKKKSRELSAKASQLRLARNK
jgi:hypothetical protein